jgi:hypothetical protein
MTTTKKVKAWAVVLKCDDWFLPDVSHPDIGDVYHVNTNEADAKRFVKKMKCRDWKAIPCTISFLLPAKKKVNKTI